ncbi:sugar phosphate isomerase/epimerase family protein [Salinisphaera hydrothermalis]|uniref:Isomerase-like tim barrel containing protein n=1 Tax=Salinisphaera hydrothermalis (strain C41B8) TaxID=1304275 RepID=A0A084IKT6_SALHC|nr:sugar phosphate isomerase/epimerase family protein [Salinisphaera hydrothermalis]KEZ77320.1 isomerase-like tim barrel containing protein [Salinisphaera hydrothermalis C41B8]
MKHPNNPIGICSWTLGLDHDPAALAAECADLGLDGLQYSGDHRAGPTAAEIRRALDDHGLKLLGLDPYYGASAEPAQTSREGAIDYYRRVIDFAAELECPRVALQGLGSWVRHETDADTARARLVEYCNTLGTHAHDAGMDLVYEAINRYESPVVRTAAAARRLRDDVTEAKLGLVLDSFHMNIEETDPEDALETHGDALAGYHIADSNRGGIGVGHIDFGAQRRVLDRIGFAGPIMIEIVLPENGPATPPVDDDQWAALRRQVRYSLDFWRMNG